MPYEEVIEAAVRAKDNGSSRFCMGAAWREVRDNKDFDRVLEMVSEVNNMGLEVCCTLGMLTYEQAERLKAAGCFAYNHNIDTSDENYHNIITTRNFEGPIQTIIPWASTHYTERLIEQVELTEPWAAVEKAGGSLTTTKKEAAAEEASASPATIRPRKRGRHVLSEQDFE